jgi:hypothetical protein
MGEPDDRLMGLEAHSYTSTALEASSRDAEFSPRDRSVQKLSSRAVRSSKNCGIPVVFVIGLDRFDDQVRFVRAVDDLP